MATAQKQALLGVCYPALNRLPSDCRPSPNIYLVWAAKTNYIRQDNKKKLRVLSEVLNLFESNDIHPVVMKGFSSAILYPKPDLRISGDIDLFIPDKYEESVILIKNLGFETSFTHKHHKFYYKGVLIELHHDIISPPFKKLHQYSVHVVEYSGVKFKVFDEITTYILLLTHSVNHLIGPGLGFRHVCDWVLNHLQENKSLDVEFVKTYITENNLMSFLCMFDKFTDILQIKKLNISYSIHNNTYVFLEKDIFRQGDCGISEMSLRKDKTKLFLLFRSLLRFLYFIRYDYRITINFALRKLVYKI